MAAQDKSIYEIFEIVSNNGQKTVDLVRGVISFSYYENVLSPMITAQAVISNTGFTIEDEDGEMASIYNGLPLNGGEVVNIKIPSTGLGPDMEFTKKNGNEFYVSSITNVLIDAERETFVLNLVSREAITNETQRVGNKFSSSQKISDSVKDIVKKFLLSDKNVDVDDTQNPYGFYGNLKKPFYLLTWLASKSVPAEVGGKSATAGYFFFETKEGYHFRSVDSLVSGEPFDIEYTYTPGIIDNQDPQKDYKILDYTTIRNQKMIENLQKGSYCTYRMYFNPVDSTFTSPQQGTFRVSDYAEKMENLGRDFKIHLPPVDKGGQSLGNVPSRFMTGTLDFGITEKKDANSRKKNADPMEYHSQAMMRYNTIFTQVLNITIPLNTSLAAGSIIKLNFAKVTIEKTKVKDVEQSGLYMIKELVHFYDIKGSFSKLKLIRDTTGKKDK
tara:strand:+ start:1689 stop:3017 length:1329 start_codon:yes stop_codon:yes gene_type:complete